jgi:ubiquinone/menaquinone biosynthesis C-methylase UbiE
MLSNKNINYAVSFINPEEIISSLGIRPGMRIAHFGCGTGFFTFPTAKIVGEEGGVYAFDILAEKIETVMSRAKLDGLFNISAKRANLEKTGGAGLPDESVDWVFMVNMLYENTNKQEVMAEAERVLKPGGKILLIDWDDSNQSIGPEMNRRVSKDELISIIGKNKLAVEKKIKVSNFHFGWIISK